MPITKNAFQRYRIIDQCIRSSSKPFPTKEELRKACEEELFGTDRAHVCDSTIEKDLRYMRSEHDAPIKFHRLERGYYYTDDKTNNWCKNKCAVLTFILETKTVLL